MRLLNNTFMSGIPDLICLRLPVRSRTTGVLLFTHRRWESRDLQPASMRAYKVLKGMVGDWIPDQVGDDKQKSTDDNLASNG